MLEEILAYNKKFVEDKGYEAYITNKYPDKKIAILSCMLYCLLRWELKTAM